MRFAINACAIVFAFAVATPAFAQATAAPCGVRTGCPPTQVPEPGSMMIFAAGAGWLIRRQAKSRV